MTLTPNLPGAIGQINTPTGGQKSVGLVLSIGKGGRVRPDVTWVTVRVQEEKDSTTDPSHPVEHPFAQNHVDYTFDLAGPWRKQLCSLETAAAVAGSAETTGSPTAEGPAGWQQFWLYCTQNKPVVSNTARCGNASWNTTQGQTSDADGAGPLLPTTLLGHNGPHSVHIVAWGGSNWSQRESSAQALGNFPFEQKKLDGSGWEAQSFNNALPTLTRNIGNLVIKDVSTSNGTQDYLLFDPAKEAEDKLRYPSIKFKIKDEGDPHKYLWTIKVNDTNAPSWIKKATVRGVASAPGEVIVQLNNTANQAAQNQHQDQLLEDWGTYSFDIFVAEVETLPNNGFVTSGGVEDDPFSELSLPRFDYIAFKQGTKGSSYYLTIPKDVERERHYLQPKWREKGEGEFEDYFEVGYYLHDSLSKSASKVWFDLYSPRLTAKVTNKELNGTTLDTNFTQEVFKSDVPMEENPEWDAVDEEHTFIGIFMALDSHADLRRDHLPGRALAVNDRPHKEAASFRLQKIDQDDPSNTLWEPIGEAIYTGSIASTADNIQVTVVPTNLSKQVRYANWFVTWGPTATTSDKYKFPSGIFNAPQGHPGDTATFDLNPNDKTPRAGYYQFGCTMRFKDGTSGEATSQPIRVGVRTDDAIVFGWIHPVNILLPSTTEATGDITGILPEKGLAMIGSNNVAQTGLDFSTSTLPPSLGTATRLAALYKIARAGSVLGQLSECKDNPVNIGTQPLTSLYVDIEKLVTINGRLPDILSRESLSYGFVFSDKTPTGDRKYALYWQFKYASNEFTVSSVPRTISEPGRYDFKNANKKFTDYNRLKAFSNLRQNNWVREDTVYSAFADRIPNVFLPVAGELELGKGGTVYKMLNHFQVRYLLDAATGQKIDSMRALNHGLTQNTWIGITADPLTAILGVSGQKGPLEGKVSQPGGAMGYINTGIIRQVNDGSPDEHAVKGFATLTRHLDAFWEDIGSQIYFKIGKFEPTMIVQTYPTYEMFVNGEHEKTDPQAETPIGHFYYKSYPFGLGRTSGAFNETGFQGGRNGQSIPNDPSQPLQPDVQSQARLAPIEQGMPR